MAYKENFRIWRLKLRIHNLAGTNANRHIIDIPFVRWILILSFCLSVLIAVCILSNEKFNWNLLSLTSVGSSQLIKALSLPIGILTFSLAIIALIATNHRSVQTSAQLKELTYQNTISNYYNILEKFSKYIDSGGKGTSYFVIKHPRLLYKRIFPLNNEEYFTFRANEKDLYKTIEFINIYFVESLSYLADELYDRKNGRNVIEIPPHFTFSSFIADLHTKVCGDLEFLCGYENNEITSIYGIYSDLYEAVISAFLHAYHFDVKAVTKLNMRNILNDFQESTEANNVIERFIELGFDLAENNSRITVNKGYIVSIDFVINE